MTPLCPLRSTLWARGRVPNHLPQKLGEDTVQNDQLFKNLIEISGIVKKLKHFRTKIQIEILSLLMII
jgi:hypothetical protein